MSAISLYRGSLHRFTDIPRRWPMPQRTISLSQFRYLLRKRNLSISRFLAGKPSLNSSPYPSAEKGNQDGTRETVCPKGVSSFASYSEPSGSAIPSQPNGKVEAEVVEDLDDCETVVALTEDRPVLAGADSMEVIGMAVDCGEDIHGKEEVILEVDVTNGNEGIKRDIEKKLDALNAKKHYLVQMLKQILNAEEEIKRRSIQSAVTRSYVPPQPEASAQMSCAARNPPKASEVSFGGDAGGESDIAANHIIQARQWPPMPVASPSTTSIGKTPHSPFHHNAVRVPRGNIPHQATTSSSLMSSSTASPSRLIPAVSISGTHFVAASSPSLSTSVGTSSPFRDFRMK